MIFFMSYLSVYNYVYVFSILIPIYRIENDSYQDS